MCSVYLCTAGSPEESDWSKQVGGASVTSDPHRWPDSVKSSQQLSRNSNDVITITSQDTLQSLLARVGLTEHMDGVGSYYTYVAFQKEQG